MSHNTISKNLNISSVNEVSNELLARYKSAAGKDASSADKEGDINRGNKRFRGIINATHKQFKNDSKNKDMEEGTMGGINRSAPAQDVSYEKMLQDSNIYEQVLNKWLHEQKLNELSVDKLNAYKTAASDPSNVRSRPLGKIAKTVQSYHRATDKISAQTGDRTNPNDQYGPIGKNRPMKEDANNERIASTIKIRHTDLPVIYKLINGEIKFVDLPQPVRIALYSLYQGLPYDIHNQTNPELIDLLKNIINGSNESNVKEDITPWGGYTPDDKKANALSKSPKSSMTGSEDIPFSELVKDSIQEHGLKWAFNFYVIKHGLPPQHFKIYAGL
jgi:hypothetical protein